VTEVVAESTGAVVTEAAVAEGAGVGAIDAFCSANRRSNQAFCSAKSLRISSSKSLVEGFMVEHQNRRPWYQMLATW
jgi:hypothetical protein